MVLPSQAERTESNTARQHTVRTRPIGYSKSRRHPSAGEWHRCYGVSTSQGFRPNSSDEMRVNDELGPQFQAAHAHHGGRVEECRMKVLAFPQLVGHENGGNFRQRPAALTASSSRQNQVMGAQTAARTGTSFGVAC